jgi:hypothetical protein
MPLVTSSYYDVDTYGDCDPMIQKRSNTIKDVATLKQLFDSSQLVLATEFQRNSVWPKAAKAYLLDTILTDRPIPYLYFRRSISAQTGRSQYEVIDGQQRLRAILEFLDDGFALTESKNRALKGKYFSDLRQDHKADVLSYDLYVEELTGYSDADITEMFVRMNRYVVKLSPQEIRHAKFSGKFKDFTEAIGEWPFWKEQRVFTALQLRRMRAVEFAAEVVILLIEGPQDKKSAVDLYYGEYERKLPFEKEISSRLGRYLKWIAGTITELRTSRYRKPTDFYALLGAADRVSRHGGRLDRLDQESIAKALQRFENQTKAAEPTGRAARYLAAASRQTDNLAPRMTRIEILSEVLSEA